MVSTKGDETAPTGETSGGAAAPVKGQGKATFSHNPATVSSLSSLETAGYEHNDGNNASEQVAVTQQSTKPYHPLPPITASSVAHNTLLQNNSTHTTASTAEPSTGGQQQQQQLQPPPPPSSISLMGRTTMQLSPSTGVVVSAAPTSNTVPEFLYQLTKMLTENNRDIIEWSNGKIEVHNPHKLETHVLNRYFRHSKFASFQRQLNYFGFRKIAGKGKMAPCSYVNDSTTNELGSLLLVKRKQGNEPKAKNGKKREREQSNASGTIVPPSTAGAAHSATPGFSGSVYQSTVNHAAPDITVDQSQKALARVAVGKGVRHGYVPKQPAQNSNAVPGVGSGSTPSVVAPSPVQASLNALTNNYRNSLNELHTADQNTHDNASHSPPAAAATEASAQTGSAALSYVPGSLHRDDSLVDLAMIPFADEGTGTGEAAASSGFSFVDFPFDPNYLTGDDFNGSSQG